MFQHEVEKLKVGDLVAITPAYQSHHTPYVTDAKVTKINGHGHVTVEKGTGKWIVDKRGNEHGRSKSSVHYYSLMDNDTAKSRNEAIKVQLDQNRKVNEILALFADHKTYGGDYKISTEVKQNLLEKVTAL